jgi:RND family efflux transporter MFP subunit
MKKLLIPALVVFIAACSKPEAGDKKAQLDSLKKEYTAIGDKIKVLEAEIALTDTTNVEKIIPVAITEAKPQAFVHYLDIQGKVDADENITISAKMPGTITKVNVEAGDEVRVGQVLGETDNAALLKGVEELKTGLAFATDVFNKQQKLWDQKIGSEIQYLQAKNTKEGLEQKMATLKEQVEMTYIKSPINGTVDEVYFKLGGTVSPGFPAVRVVNTKSLKAKAEVAEGFASKVKKGNEVEIHFPDLAKDVSSKISFVGKAINANTRTFTIEADLPSQEDFHPNMIAVLRVVDFKSDAALVVPLNIIQNSEEGSYIMVAANENGKTVAKKTLITVGHTYRGHAEVLSGISAGDKIITTGFQGLNNGELISF